MFEAEIERIIEKKINEKLADVRTHIPAVITEYNPDTNTCKCQPCINRLRFDDPDNLTNVEMGILEDVPVRQFGSGKLLLTLAPQVGTYGVLHVFDREVEQWLSMGGVVPPFLMRSFDISDCYFEPGIFPLVDDGDNGKIDEDISTDSIQLRTRSAVTAISVKDDETIELKNEKCTITIDTDGNLIVSADGNFTTSATETVLQDGTDWAVQFTAMKAAFDTLKGELNTLVTTFTAHVHPGVAAGPASTGPTPTPGVAPTASMDSAKIDDVRLP